MKEYNFGYELICKMHKIKLKIYFTNFLERITIKIVFCYKIAVCTVIMEDRAFGHEN